MFKTTKGYILSRYLSNKDVCSVPNILILLLRSSNFLSVNSFLISFLVNLAFSDTSNNSILLVIIFI